jgi:oxygen-dependent protoporphyrinogen oxidase
MSVAVVGGGVTGLAAAYRLHSRGHLVTVYEAAPRVGGVVRTERREGYLAEAGPNTLTEPDPLVAALLDELGLAGRRVEAAAAARTRYVVRGGRLVALPSSPRDLLTTRAFSFRAKLAILGEPLVRGGDPAAEESIAGFVRRRLGDEVLDYAADPFVGGIYAGDPALLSMRHAMPRLYALEREHGSLVRGALARGRRSLRPFSFPDGLGEIPLALAARLGDRIRLAAPVQTIAHAGPGWLVHGADDETRHDAIILAVPAHAFGTLRVEGPAAARAAELAAIPHAPVAVVTLGFRRGDVAHPLDGFGVLVPAVERCQVLGTLFTSTLFPGRAPPGHVTLTTFVGGARQPELAGLEPGALVTLVQEELARLLGARGEPTFRHVVRWSRAIPQYVLGYERWLGLMAEVEGANPGLFLAGSYRGGVALGDALRSGLEAAMRVEGGG